MTVCALANGFNTPRLSPESNRRITLQGLTSFPEANRLPEGS